MPPDTAAMQQTSTSADLINVLALSGIVRSDIRTSIAGASGVAEGVPLTVTLELLDTDGCTPLSGFAVYIWHCDRAGNYSMYSADAASENYLRGVQETDANGSVTFQTIFPACYTGRWPHVHFEIYPSLDSATDYKNKLATSQLALPEEACNLVFAQPGYELSVTNLQRVTLASDMVFSDSYVTQLPELSGSVDAGYTAKLSVGVKLS
jgi:protocatechuate 3,4-dioxygenase beta subunit